MIQFDQILLFPGPSHLYQLLLFVIMVNFPRRNLDLKYLLWWLYMGQNYPKTKTFTRDVTMMRKNNSHKHMKPIKEATAILIDSFWKLKTNPVQIVKYRFRFININIISSELNWVIYTILGSYFSRIKIKCMWNTVIT